MSSHSGMINSLIRAQEKELQNTPNTSFHPPVFFQSNQGNIIKDQCPDQACNSSVTFHPFQCIGNNEYITSVLDCLIDKDSIKNIIFEVEVDTHVINLSKPSEPQRFKITEDQKNIRDSMIIYGHTALATAAQNANIDFCRIVYYQSKYFYIQPQPTSQIPVGTKLFIQPIDRCLGYKLI